MAFRYLSVEEMSEIDLDSDKIYDVVFHDSDIFKNLRMQDFIVNLYN
ncbi:MAG: hypothetical protein P1U46_01030 [Patescibacteria group bacterium]|nr:hypothetical protein [Patescibacteria group bacterium]